MTFYFLINVVFLSNSFCESFKDNCSFYNNVLLLMSAIFKTFSITFTFILSRCLSFFFLIHTALHIKNNIWTREFYISNGILILLSDWFEWKRTINVTIKQLTTRWRAILKLLDIHCLYIEQLSLKWSLEVLYIPVIKFHKMISYQWSHLQI